MRDIETVQAIRALGILRGEPVRRCYHCGNENIESWMRYMKCPPMNAWSFHCRECARRGTDHGMHGAKR